VILVQSQYCPQNHRCPTLSVCPADALKQQEYQAPTIDSETCIECGRCVASCSVFKEVPSSTSAGYSGHENGKNGSTGAGGIRDKQSRRMGV